MGVIRTIVHAPGLWHDSVVREADLTEKPFVPLPAQPPTNVVRLGGIRGRKLVPKEERERRLERCQECENWKGEPRFDLGHCNRCAVCGGTRLHVWLWASRCQKGAWG